MKLTVFYPDFDLLKQILKLNKNHPPPPPTPPPTPTRGTTFQCLNQVWSWSNLQDRFIIINQDDLRCQRWPYPSNLQSGTLNVLQVLQITLSKLNQINSQFLTKFVKSTEFSPPWVNFLHNWPWRSIRVTKRSTFAILKKNHWINLWFWTKWFRSLN